MALIVKIGANLNDFDKQMRKLTKDVNNVGGHLQDIGGKLTAGLTLPLAAVGAASIKTADDFQKSQGMMQARLGETSGRAKELESIARDVWKNGFGENVQAAADGVTMVNQNMKGMSNKEINGVTKSAFMLSDVFGFDLNESTRAGKALMDNFGVSGTKAMDLITVGAQKGGDYSGELLDTISEYSVQFSSMGMSAEDMFNIFIQGAQNGAFNLDKVGDAVKEFNIRAQDGSKTTNDGFKMIGLNANQMGTAIAKGGEDGRKAFMATVAALAKMKDPMKQNQAGVALFGTQWEDVRGKVIKAMDPAVNKLGEVDGAAKRAGESAYNSLGDKFQQTMRSLGEALEPIGEVLLNMANQVFPVIQNAVSTLSSAFQSLSPSTQTFIVVLGMIVAAIGPVIAVIGTMVIVFGQLSAACTVLGISVMGTAAKMVGAFLPAGMGVRGAFGLMTKGLWQWIADLGKSIVSVVVWSGKMIASAAVASAQFIASMARITASAAVSAAKFIGVAILYGAQWAFIGIQATINAVKVAAAWALSTGAAMAKAVASIIATAAVFIARWIMMAAGAMAQAAIMAAAWFVALGPIGWVSAAVIALVALIIANWNTVKKWTIQIWGSISNFLSNLWTGIKSGVSSAVNTVSSVVSSVWNGIKSVTSSVWNGIKNAIVSPISAAKDKIAGIVNAIKGFFTGMHLSLPKIKMPHFSIDGKFSLAPPSVPKLNIKWFKTGGVIKGTPGGSLIGAGEAGDEAIVPLSNKSKMLPFAQAIASMIDHTGSGTDEPSGPKLLQLENIVNLDGHELARILQPLLDIANADKITIDAIMSGGVQ
ncbi:phage tail tape measure protein [Sporolactobacillus nakayamae]|uniref:Phage-related minor tail protein n=1 Tax=Sporolactobacillus nakayamae TaxID=269670 RepID=A0A1I2P5I3_9BACL|nr:phage tail tape measure protein [Sporolactobacillus nakayamae]SFG10740.1 Phage-related minor tail protein [Sporolactobacillus nakayamae]